MQMTKYKIGLSQGSVLVLALFIIYKSDQQEFTEIRRFINADDLCIATQSKFFRRIAEKTRICSINSLQIFQEIESKCKFL